MEIRKGDWVYVRYYKSEYAGKYRFSHKITDDEWFFFSTTNHAARIKSKNIIAKTTDKAPSWVKISDIDGKALKGGGDEN